METEEFPAEVLAAVGITAEVDLQPWRDLWGRRSEEISFWRPLFREAETRNYQRFFSKLQAFAAACRAEAPLPAVPDLTPREREQHRLLVERLRIFPSKGVVRPRLIRPEFGVASVLITSHIGLAAVTEVFDQIGAVVLTATEWSLWRSRLPKSAPPNRDLRFGHWTMTCVCDLLTSGDPLYGLAVTDEFTESQPPLVADDAFWVLKTGVFQSGQGDTTLDIYRWDGHRATCARSGIDFHV